VGAPSISLRFGGGTFRLREPVNGLIHLVGALLSVVGLIVMVVAAVHYGTVWHVVAYSIFGISLVLLYSASSLYHLLPLSERGIRSLERIDHIMIFVLIAGTYTPFCLVPLRGPWGWSLFGIIWALALAGILFKIFWMHAPQWLSTTIYLLMGWVVIVAIFPLVATLPTGALIWLVLGGVIYSIGAVVFAFEWPNPFPKVLDHHAIWHLLVMAGSFCHFWAVFSYLTFLS